MVRTFKGIKEQKLNELWEKMDKQKRMIFLASMLEEPILGLIQITYNSCKRDKNKIDKYFNKYYEMNKRIHSKYYAQRQKSHSKDKFLP